MGRKVAEHKGDPPGTAAADTSSVQTLETSRAINEAGDTHIDIPDRTDAMAAQPAPMVSVLSHRSEVHVQTTAVSGKLSRHCDNVTCLGRLQTLPRT